MRGRVGSWVCRIIWHARFRISGYDGVNQNKEDETTRLERSIRLLIKTWASSLLEGKIGMDWICCSRMAGASIPSLDARAGLASREALKSFPISVSVVTRHRIGTHFVGTAGISVDMADG